MLHHYWYFQAIDDLVFALYLHSIWRKIKHWATYEQLALGTSEAVSIKINAKDLWHKTTFLIMDSANNNLKTGQPILEILQITYVSNHLQCKSLSVEALDKSNLKILLNIEKEHGLQMKRENINPSMRSFFRGQKPIAVAGIKCQMSIFAHKKSATTTNIADEFDLIIEREDNVKYLSFCHEWKFCKLDLYGPQSLMLRRSLKCFLMRQCNLIYTFSLVNCVLYLECEFFHTVLANFPHKFSFVVELLWSM